MRTYNEIRSNHISGLDEKIINYANDLRDCAYIAKKVSVGGKCYGEQYVAVKIANLTRKGFINETKGALLLAKFPAIGKTLGRNFGSKKGEKLC